MPDSWPDASHDREPRTSMTCRLCGQFSSAQTCFYCSWENPLGAKYLVVEEANKRANLIISQQADELKSMSDKVDLLEPLGGKYAALQTKVRDYLTYGSIDGKVERQTLRKELAELVK